MHPSADYELSLVSTGRWCEIKTLMWAPAACMGDLLSERTWEIYKRSPGFTIDLSRQLAFVLLPCFYEEMSTITPEDFFRLYEQANNDFDIQSIAKLYADTFMFGDPGGVQSVKKEDFVKVLPRRKDFMKTTGLLSSRVDSVQASTLDPRYVLAKTVWNMHFRASNGDEVTRKVSSTYVLSTLGNSFEIVFQLDHQDLMKIAQELRAQS